MADRKIPTLKFNSRAFWEEYKQQLMLTTNKIMEVFEKDVKLRLNKSKDDIERNNAIIEGKNIISAEVIAYADAIMESFGTGSKMDTSNPALSDYKNSSLWNPSRNTLAISGRPSGEYTNIYGETRYSTGTSKGKNLEKINPNLFKPQTPTKAIQQAEQWLQQNSGYFESEMQLFYQSIFSDTSRFFIYN